MAVALQAYYDGSGKSNDPQSRFLTLAGYVGTESAWEAFEERWQRVLDKYPCEYLHMKEANQRVGQYAGWSREQVQLMLADFFNTCLAPLGWTEFKGQFYGVSCTVNLEDYRKVCAELPVVASYEPEAICVNSVVTRALQGLPEDGRHWSGKRDQVELFFDLNENFLHKINRVWLRQHRNPDSVHHMIARIASLGPVAQERVLPLQAADFLAWHTNHYYAKGWKVPSGALAGSMRMFATPLHANYYDYEGLIRRFGNSPPPAG